MPQVVTCPFGHRWESAGPGERCPVCAAAGQQSTRGLDTPSVEGTAQQDELPPLPRAGLSPARGTSTVAGKGAALKSAPAIDGYEILGELGRGGMGVVYRARQVRLGRLVALKMIRAGEHADAKEFDRFRSEAEAVARLQHPNIVQIFEVGEANGLPYLALELVEGESLARLLRDGPLPPRPAAALVETLARALQHAHDRGVVHRDLKPANILLAGKSEARNPKSEKEGAAGSVSNFDFHASNFEPKVTDFGIAKRTDGEGQTTTGAILGTPSYMAPEQAAGVSHVGPAADVYALGAVLYELLTGRPPFLAPSAVETLRLVVNDEAVPPTRFQPGLPRDLETVCLKCLEKAPRKRYGSAEALADDLRRFQAGEPTAARPVGRAERAWRWCVRKPALASAIAAAVILLLAGSSVSTFFAVRASRRASEAEHNADVASANEQTAIQARRETEQVLVEGLLLPLGGTADPTSAEIEALGKLAAFPRDDVRVLFVQAALADPVSTAALSRRVDEALHAAVGLSADRRQRVASVLLECLRTTAREETRVACVRAAGVLRDPDPELARAAVVGTLDALRYSTGKELGATATAAEDLIALIGHMTPADRAAASQTARANLLNEKGERRFVILAAFAAASPPEEAAPLVQDLVPQLEKAFASLTRQHDVRALERAVRMLAGRLTRDDAAALAAAIAKCAARNDLTAEARNIQARRRSLARSLVHLLPRLPAEEAAAFAGKVIPLLEAGVKPPLASEEVDWARVTLALARFLPGDERARAAAATTRVVALFSLDLGHNQQLLPVADHLIDLKGDLPERDAKRLARDCLQAIQSLNRDPHSFHAAVAVLAAYRGHLTAEELEAVLRRLVERRPEAPHVQPNPVFAAGATDRGGEAPDEADLLATTAAFADALPREYLESLRVALNVVLSESRQQANPRLRVAAARALVTLGPALRLDAEVATRHAHALLRERDGLSVLNGYQRTEEGDLVLDAFCRLFPLFGDQQLIDLMKQPLCRRVERERIARELGRRHGQSFRTVWEMAAWVEAQGEKLDLNSPPTPMISRR